MDLLGSILNAMDKPPAVNEKQKEAIKSKLAMFYKFGFIESICMLSVYIYS